MTILLLESGKSCFTCLIPVSTAGYQRAAIYPGNRETARGLLSLSVAMFAERVLKITAFQLASPPPHIQQKKPLLHRREFNHSFASILVETLGSCTCMARGAGSDVDGQMAEEEEKSGLSRQAFMNEKEPEVLKQDGCTKGQVTIPDPRFLRCLRHSARRNGAVGLATCRTYPQFQVSIRSKCRWRLQWHEHL